MSNTIKRLFSLLALLVVLQPTLIACNTIEGAGEDIEEAGEAIDEETEENTPY